MFLTPIGPEKVLCSNVTPAVAMNYSKHIYIYIYIIEKLLLCQFELLPTWLTMRFIMNNDSFHLNSVYDTKYCVNIKKTLLKNRWIK